MELNILKPRKALNKAFLKVKTSRREIELFKINLIGLLDKINEKESEEFHKNLVSDFLKNTWYGPAHFINTKGRNDLVIHNALNPGSSVGVIIEAKKPTNKTEMMTTGSINSKAFQELVLYYLRERITAKNLEIKQLVATNIYEWFIFDATLFEKEFAQNKSLVKQFTDFDEGRLSGNTTDFFYKNVAMPAIEAISHEITFTYFDIREYNQPLRNADKKDDNILISLYKLLSPEHLLKLPFANDSNSLDKTFYTELLHIIGLTETKDGGKKLIQRKKEGERNSASLLESAIFQLDNLDKISRLEKPFQFGETNADRLFNVALELSITWMNRILFLKLLEAQLIKYHKGDKAFAFLHKEKVQNFDDLNNLFFSVLARKPDERNEEVKKQFANVPYLNSSLFEPTGIEHSCLFISQLKDSKLPLLSSTVIKDNTGSKRTGGLLTIEYLFEFLNAYDFASEGSEEIQEENKRLINASVLGLIFEKINGYKDGSFFTPGFITMYMCRETIRRAVVQKFNEAGSHLTGFKNLSGVEDVYDAVGRDFTKDQANEIINSLKICDPAVGSGHFLVSALNEIIAIKSELKILRDRTGKTLRDYHVTVENDELIVTDDDGQLFGYNPNNKESQRIQETLFHEKQILIENCLFGVDINPNSVKICRLRLWIELLKNAYYKSFDQSGAHTPEHLVQTPGWASPQLELETLPNIDINIKCGNSLISRYALDADLKKALKSSKWTIEMYRIAVMTYRNAKSKEEKRAMEQLIAKIKGDFESDIAANDKRIVKLNLVKGELFALTTQTTLFDRTKAEKAVWDKQVKSKTDTIISLETELEEVRSNKIYENAFEWRFEFPEVLNEDGDFVGFDVVIGNPPYGVKALSEEKGYFKINYEAIIGKYDSYGFFIERGIKVLKSSGQFGFITPHTWLTVIEAQTIRDLILRTCKIIEIDQLPTKVFEDATVDTINIFFEKAVLDEPYQIRILTTNLDERISSIEDFSKEQFTSIDIWKSTKIFNIKLDEVVNNIILKLRSYSVSLNQICDLSVGVQAYDSYVGQTEDIINNRAYHGNIQKDETFVKELNGKDIHRYSLQWSGESWISYGAWLAHPRQIKYFNRERILVREITNSGKYGIIACLEDEYLINYKSILNIILKDECSNKYDLKFILAIINSSLFTWYFNISSNKIVTNTFPRISIYDLKEFPINISNALIQNQITDIVSQILSAKTNISTADTTALESEIDRLVYQLYDLTEEEIRIVEGK